MMDQQTINKTREVEDALIGSILLNSDIYDLVRLDVKPGDFYDSKNQSIMQAIDKLYNDGQPIDIITVSQDLPADHKAQVVNCLGLVGSSANHGYYSNAVKEYSRKRQLSLLAQTLDLKSKDGGSESLDLIRSVETALAEMTATERSGGEVNTHQVVDEVIDTVKRLRDSPKDVVGITTGFKSLDMKLSGLHPSDLIILAARPGRGKSAFALQLARNVAYHAKTPVLMFSLEMGAEQLVQRIISAESKVSMTKIRNGQVNEAEYQALDLGGQVIKKLPLYFNDRAGIQCADIRSQLKLHNSTGDKIGFVIVDYLQLMAIGQGNTSMVQMVTEISRGLKMIAKEFNVPVLALSQLSRAVEARGGKPRLSDLRDSGSIEQDADIVLFLHSETDEEDAFGGKAIELLVEKHRNGSTGSIDFNFDSAKMTFLEVDNISKW